MNRREFLTGNLTGLCVGAVAGFGAAKALGGAARAEAAAAAAPPTGSGEAKAADAGARALGTERELAGAKLSFAQQGEDLILANVADLFKLDKPSYIDIGAWDPIAGSNTYLFYRGGGRGVLVEPNPAMIGKLEDVRKGDAVVNAGIGVGGATDADYYIFQGDGQLNTFSKDQAEKWKAQLGPAFVKEVRKMPLLDINDVLKGHFDAAPTLFSVDAEGMDLGILQTLDFERWRPKMFCVETSVVGSWDASPDILKLMKAKRYQVREGT